MEEKDKSDFYALRDIQEIKLTLKYFVEDIVSQLTLLREAMAQSAQQKNEINKEVNNIEFLLKSFEQKINDYDSNIEKMIIKLEQLENKIIDKNNPEALALVLGDTMFLLKKVETIINEFKSLLFSEEEKQNLFKTIRGMDQCILKINDKKKNLMWWVDWIYKIAITGILIWNFILNAGV